MTDLSDKELLKIQVANEITLALVQSCDESVVRDIKFGAFLNAADKAIRVIEKKGC